MMDDYFRKMAGTTQSPPRAGLLEIIWSWIGAFLGIAIIYFVAAKIRTFGQYTVGDILEVRYGKFARLFGALALIVAFTTIVAYQFRAGGYILNIATDGGISVEQGQMIAAGFVILFTALGGMVAVAHTVLPNGIIIVLACCLALPFVAGAAGGIAIGLAVGWVIAELRARTADTQTSITISLFSG